MHKQFDVLLQEYIDGELDFLKSIILVEHLVSCQNCRRELNQLKLMDWDLKHQPLVEVPLELESYRMAAVKNHIAEAVIGEKEGSHNKAWYLQHHIFQYTFSFISYNPVNKTVARTAKKTVSLFTRAAGKSIKKRSPLLTRFIPGQA